MNQERAVRALAVLGIFGVAVVASICAGAPEDLPDVALGWEPLLHVLRAAALLGALGAVLLVGWRATKGEFPIKFGNLEYPTVHQAAAEAEKVSASQERRLLYLEVLAGIRPPDDLANDREDA
jgi:hypothetical protein